MDGCSRGSQTWARGRQRRGGGLNMPRYEFQYAVHASRARLHTAREALALAHPTMVVAKLIVSDSSDWASVLLSSASLLGSSPLVVAPVAMCLMLVATDPWLALIFP